MQLTRYKNYILNVLLVNCCIYVNGCEGTLFSPKGFVAIEQKNLILISFLVMLLVIVPVIFMTFFFVFRFRESNYNNIKSIPIRLSSNFIEIFVWGIPVIIIMFLSVLSWKSTHYLDPGRLIISNNKPIRINVVSLDWKWLFIYPEEKIATINELVIPVNTPIIFELTSNSVMNSFFIPLLGSQMYTMAGMTTRLNLIANIPGEYQGISANYSGDGFSDMKFKVLVASNNKLFNEWTKKVNRLSLYHLNSICDFNRLIVPISSSKMKYYSHVNNNLFSMIVKNFTKIEQ